MRSLLPLVALAVSLPACQTDACLSGNAPDCVVPTPCEGLTFTCEADAEPGEIRTIGPDDPLVSTTQNALAATGDVLLANDRVVAVIDAIDHPHYLAPTGGNLVDLSNRGEDNDSLRQILTVTGLLPEDAPRWSRIEQYTEPDGTVAAQVWGELDGRPGVTIITRYELRPCEPGLRVRTEVVNGSDDPLSMLVGDGFYWGSRESLAFAPTPGAGFEHPSFGLSTVGSALRETPYMVGASHVAPAAAYATIGCNEPALQGFHSEEVSLIGAPKRVVMPRDYVVLERFIAVAPGQSTSAGADVALEVRKQLFEEPYTELSGKVAREDGAPFTWGNAAHAQITISEGLISDAPEDRTPWTHVVPDPDGSFRVRVPTDRTYTLSVEAFGLTVSQAQVDVAQAEADAGTITVPSAGSLNLNATVDGEEDEVLVFLRATDEAQEASQLGQFLGHFRECAPLLGNPFGSSPACDRLLVNGVTPVVVPPGTYDVYAVAGPFTTLGHAGNVTVPEGGTVDVTLALTTLPLQPAGTLSGDFHVHGGPSFDSSIDAEGRVRSFVAARVEVVASTEHDVMAHYAPLVEALGLTDRVAVMDGTESTGHILFDLYPDSSFPKVIGHFNFWPLPYDPVGPWRGAAWDEQKEPGQLMQAMVEQGWDPETGIAQLNHPVGAGIQFGRNYGWVDAIEINTNDPFPATFDGSGPSMFLRTPPNTPFSNADFHTQEVMNSSDNTFFQAYRAFWFYELNQGITRTGTANSDSHSLADNVLGFPRNLVWTDTTVATFDAARFNGDVKAGRVLGTNGPVVLASTVDAAGETRLPSLEAFAPGAGAALRLAVRAAPWVPVDEVRIIVNGALARTISDLPAPADPFGTEGLDRLTVDIPLSELLPPSGDAWIVVEAGAPLEPNADLDCNGFVDTGDNNGDGVITWADVADLTEDPGTACLSSVGPMKEPEKPARGEPGYAFRVVVTDGYPTAFTNPLLFDRDGSGAFEGVK